MKKQIIFFGTFLIMSFAHSQTVRYVRPVSYGLGDGSSWANASNDIQEMINQSAAGDSVWVAEGTYYPLQDPSDDGIRYLYDTFSSAIMQRVYTTDRDKAFLLKSNVKIYGGFPDNGTAVWSNRNWKAYPSILNGNIGDPNDSTDNCRHIVISSGDVGNACLDGFTITNGYAVFEKTYNYPSYIIVNGNEIGHIHSNKDYGDNIGGAVYNCFSSPVYANLNICNNQARSGGGMYNEFSSPNLTNVNISHNSGGSGKGMHNYYSNPVLTNVNINNNKTYPLPVNTLGHLGGGMYNNHSSPVLTNVVISENYAAMGGGIYNIDSSNVILTNVIISNNTSGDGGGIYSWLSNVVLTNVVISGNIAYSGGGGMYNDYECSPILTNVAIIGNKVVHTIQGEGSLCNSTRSGGGIFNGVAHPILTNVTISGNYAYHGGGICESHSQSIIRNSIIWGNYATDIGKNTAVYVLSCNVIIPCQIQYYHSLVERNIDTGAAWDPTLGFDMGNNLPCNANPLFVAPEPAFNAPTTAGDYRLTRCSPAINVGYNAYLNNTITTDLDNAPRISNGIIDMGAYEFQPPYILSTKRDTICYGDTAKIAFIFMGASTNSPWELIYTTNNGISYDTVKNITNNLFYLKVSPLLSTTYKFVSINDTNCMFSINDSTQIKVLPIPTVDNIFNDTLCSGNKTHSIAFSGTANFYEWILSGDNIDSIPTDIQTGNFGNYIVENKGNTLLTTSITVRPKYTENGRICTGRDTAFSITVHPLYISSDTVEICQGYYMFHGLSYTATGIYHHTIPVVHGCDSIFELVLTVNPLPERPVISRNENVLTSSVSESYQWYLDNTAIPNATKQSYTCIQNGIYFVKVTNEYGCSSLSKHIEVFDVGILKIADKTSTIKIYPNPAGTQLRIENYEVEMGDIEIFDIVGKKIVHCRLSIDNSIDISHLARGMYYLKIDGKMFKVVKL